MTLRLTEADLARDIHAVLARVREEGVEVIIEQDHRPVAVIKTPQGPGRKLSECIAIAKAYEENLGYAPVPDPDFAVDMQAAIDAHREPLNPPHGISPGFQCSDRRGTGSKAGKQLAGGTTTGARRERDCAFFDHHS